MKNEKYYKRFIYHNQKRFLKLESKILKEKNVNKKIKLACAASSFAISNATDIFSSRIIENVFLNEANKIKINISNEYKRRTILHVMTTAYTSGGHTRCVERWVEHLPEYTHSCAILKPVYGIPLSLKKLIVSNNGILKLFDLNLSMIEKATQLRALASRFEYVVLHTHMDDPIALISFGSKDFKRPIIFFNHADHLFWLGVSISDVVADLNSVRNKISINYRGCENTKILGIPCQQSVNKNINNLTAKKRLNIKKYKKLIFSAGSYFKYIPISEISFKNIIDMILKNNPNIIICVAGINKARYFWRKLLKKFPNNLILLGTLNYDDDFQLYLNASDLVLDSYPVGGETFAIDAIKAKKCFLTLNGLVQADFISNSDAYCKTINELVKKTDMVLNNKCFEKKLYFNIYKKFINECDKNIWKNKCEAMLKSVKIHKINNFKRNIPKDITGVTLSTVIRSDSNVRSIKNSIKKIIKSVIYFKFTKEIKIIKICGIVFLEKRMV